MEMLTDFERRHVHVHLGSKLSSLIHSAIALAVDLDIYHEPHQAAKARLGALDGSEDSVGSGGLRTLEQRRAQLGLFWLSSVYVKKHRFGSNKRLTTCCFTTQTFGLSTRCCWCKVERISSQQLPHVGTG